jgi:outer membrane protein assembly factor BamB
MNPIPSAVHDNGMVYAVSGFRGNKLLAINLDEAKGDLSATKAIKWELNADTPYVPSPLLYDGIVYLLKGNTGILSAFDAKTGKPHYALQRLEHVPNVFASPVGAKGRIYIPGQQGATMVLKAGPSYEVLATNTLDDGFDASPALVDNEIYLRGAKYLYSIGPK